MNRIHERPGARLDPTAPISPRRTVRLPESVNVQLTELCERSGRAPSDLIREALIAYLEEKLAS